jgi:hypothetical protein
MVVNMDGSDERRVQSTIDNTKKKSTHMIGWIWIWVGVNAIIETEAFEAPGRSISI